MIFFFSVFAATSDFLGDSSFSSCFGVGEVFALASVAFFGFGVGFGLGFGVGFGVAFAFGVAVAFGVDIDVGGGVRAGLPVGVGS